MNIQAVERLHTRGVRLLITVDNGITALEEIERCSVLGIDVIVTDHHKCAQRLPECVAVLAHTRPDNTYPNTEICGAATAYKLVEAMGGKADAKPYLSLAGLATVADVVPLIGENRAFVALALRAINQGECCIGLKALAREATSKERPVTSRDLAFGLSPRLNAAGRLEDASIGVELFCTEDESLAREIAGRLSELNAQRQSAKYSTRAPRLLVPGIGR